MGTIEETYVDQALTLLNSGDVSGAWEKLAEGGDNYGEASADVTSGTGIFSHVVQRYWDQVYGEGVKEQKWDIVAARHLQNYIEEIKTGNIPGNPNEILDLPDTVFIEESYAEALQYNGLSKDGAIDLALNQIEQSVTVPLNDFIDEYFPGADKAGFDMSIDMPDWHQVLEWAYGDFGDRTHENSGNYTDQSFAEALQNLGVAGVLGAKDYMEEIAGSLPEYINQKVAQLDSILQPLIDDFALEFQFISDWLDDVLSQFTTAQTEASPLVLDLDGDGVELTSLHGDGAVYWDVDQDGMAEASGWVAPDDGLLALDRNGNGAIDNHSELFGTESEDGFVMLSSADSNGDGVIDAADTDYADLRVWQDANGDGISQADELHTLADLNISEISLNATAVEQLVNGNTIRSESTFTMNGQAYDIADAWFAYDNANTVFAGDYNLDVRTLFLPTARGYGDMSDPHIAAVNDNDFVVLFDCA